MMRFSRHPAPCLFASRQGFSTWATSAAAALLVFLIGSHQAQAKAPTRINYSRDIHPILSNTCFKCHGPDEKERKAGLRLDTKEGILARLESGERAVVPGKAAASEIYRRLTSTDPAVKMPPPDSGKTVSHEQINLIKSWIDQGAEFHKHWAFLPPKRPAVPKLNSPKRVQNPIDAFVIAKLQEEGLQPSEPADRTTLIRRVTFDLTGLPPTAAEVDAFLADTSPNAYDRVVDRLLDSPEYGEHMTRYWLDAARYGDTHGLHLDNERSIWPYRDWVIRAFNGNLPFDQFAVDQLAGDLLPHPTIDQRVATGFCRCNVTTGEGGSIEEEFAVRYATERVETTGTVFLGITLGCCVCHDHKFDPVSQREFYRLFSYFNSVTERGLDGNALLPPPTVRVATAEQAAQVERLKKQVAAVEKKIRDALAKVRSARARADSSVATPGSQAVSETGEKKAADPKLSQRAWEATAAKNLSSLPRGVRRALEVPAGQRTPRQKKGLRDYFVENVLSTTRPIFDPLHAELAAAQSALEKANQLAPSSMVMEDAPQRRDTFLLIRGAYDRKGEKVTTGVPVALGPALPPEAPPNRLALARWIVDPRHPLTARVTVNRLWQHVFGTGIVKTAEDFGSQGEWPTHPELLDWLATEFLSSGWDVKHMMRLMVTSATYRQSSHVSPMLAQLDPENRFLARGPRYRMDAEMVRDTALSVSGLLTRRLGGKSVKPYQPPNLWEPISYTSSNTARFVQDHGQALYRRSMYTFWKRTSPPPSLTTFDAPSREACVVRRSRTNTPLQALVLMNDEQFVEAARHLAERMIREGGSSPAERLAFAFRLATSRKPRSDELNVLVRLYESQKRSYAKNVDAARKLVHVGDSPWDESLDPVDVAALTLAANVILNLDETVTKG